MMGNDEQFYDFFIKNVFARMQEQSSILHQLIYNFSQRVSPKSSAGRILVFNFVSIFDQVAYHENDPSISLFFPERLMRTITDVISF